MHKEEPRLCGRGSYLSSLGFNHCPPRGILGCPKGPRWLVGRQDNSSAMWDLALKPKQGGLCLSSQEGRDEARR